MWRRYCGLPLSITRQSEWRRKRKIGPLTGDGGDADIRRAPNMDDEHEHFATIAPPTQILAADTCEELPSFLGNSAAIEGQWGNISTSTFASKVNEYYDIAIHSKRNAFENPHGNAVKVLIEELTKLLDMLNGKNSMQGFSIKAFHLLIAFVLQKPSKESEAKDHLKYLEKRLAWWRDGDTDLLYKECRAIRGELSKTFRKSDNKMKSFCNLVLQGRLSAAVKVLSQTDATGLLLPTEHVRANMALLHPIGQDVNREELLQGM